MFKNKIKLKKYIYTAWMYSFPNFDPVSCSMSGSNFCFFICIQVSQETGKVVWYSHLFKSFPQFVMIPQVPETVTVFLFLFSLFKLSSVQSFSHVWLSATPCTAAQQDSLSITNSQSLLKLMSIESVMPSKYLILLSSPPAFNLSQHQGLFQ